MSCSWLHSQTSFIISSLCNHKSQYSLPFTAKKLMTNVESSFYLWLHIDTTDTIVASVG